MEQIEEYRTFEKVFVKSISEIEVFIPNLHEGISRQQIISMVKRFSYINNEAVKIDFKFVVDTTSIIVEFLANNEDFDSGLNSIGHIIIDTLRLGVSLAISRLEGKAVPRDYEDMLLDGLKSLLIQHNEDGPPDEFYKQWVLVVDDELIIRTYIEDILFNEGYLVLGASNGQEAITALSAGAFDIVFTDINMPKVSGLELLEYIRAHKISVDVIVVTGYASVKSASQAIHHGAYDYITKPFNNNDEIINAADRAMQHRLLVKKNENLVQSMRENNLKLSRYAAGLEEALNTLEEKNNALIKAERMATLGVLVAGLAHEINNPTTFIRGNIQTLSKFWDIIVTALAASNYDTNVEKFDFILKETPVLLKDMMVGTDRIVKITDGLRVFARVDDGLGKMEMCSIADIIDGAVAIVANRLKKGVIFDKSVEVVAEIMASAQQMIQVLVNLLLNAIDAVDDQVVKLVTIRAYEEDKNVCIEVIDNGVGIPKEVQDKIFDPFFTTKPVDKGTGLGLSLSEGIVSVHGGELKLVESGAEGSIFAITLPRIEHKYPDKNLAKVFLLSEPSNVYRSFESGIKAARCCEMLSLESSSDEEAILDKVGAFEPDVIVIDVRRVVSDNGEVLRKMVDTQVKSIKILGIVDGRVDNIDESSLYAYGFDSIIILPCNLRKVLVTLEELL